MSSNIGVALGTMAGVFGKAFAEKNQKAYDEEQNRIKLVSSLVSSGLESGKIANPDEAFQFMLGQMGGKGKGGKKGQLPPQLQTVLAAVKQAGGQGQQTGAAGGGAMPHWKTAEDTQKEQEGALRSELGIRAEAQTAESKAKFQQQIDQAAELRRQHPEMSVRDSLDAVGFSMSRVAPRNVPGQTKGADLPAGSVDAYGAPVDPTKTYRTEDDGVGNFKFYPVQAAGGASRKLTGAAGQAVDQVLMSRGLNPETATDAQYGEAVQAASQLMARDRSARLANAGALYSLRQWQLGGDVGGGGAASFGGGSDGDPSGKTSGATPTGKMTPPPAPAAAGVPGAAPATPANKPRWQAETPAGSAKATPAATPQAPAQASQAAADKILASLPQSIADDVKQISENRKAVPARYLNTPRGEKIMSLAEQYAKAQGRTFDQKKYQQIQRAMVGFTSGRQGDSLTALNRAAAHLDTVYDKTQALNNINTQVWNRIGNVGLKQTGDPRVDEFLTAAHLAGGELAKFMKGGSASPTKDEILLLQDELDASKSPAQIAGVLGTMAELAGGALDALKFQWSQATEGAPFTAVSPRAEQALAKLRLAQRMMQNARTGGAGASANPNASQIKTPNGTFTIEPIH